MSLTEFYESWKYLRGYALGAAGAICILSCVFGHSWNMEMDYRGPGSEIERQEQESRDRGNREAAERVNENNNNNRESSQRDQERSREYEREHGA